MSTDWADPVERLAALLDNVRPCGSGFTARCPAHDDRHNSLKIDPGPDKALIHCHAGCPPERIVAALGLTLADLFVRKCGGGPTINRGAGRRVVATYDYRDEVGELLFQVVRFDPKEFRQRRPDGDGGWAWSLDGVRRVLYRLPELLAADPAAPVAVCEGEKDADRLAALGIVATTAPQGAGKWRAEYADPLRGRRVAILVDNDPAGKAHAGQAAASLTGTAAEVKLVELPDLPPKGDVSDWLDRGGTVEDLLRVIEAAPTWRPSGEAASTVGRGVLAFPIEVLPPAIRAYVVAAAESIPVPVEMVAVPMLGAIGALLGNRLHLELKPSYREYPTLYLALIAPPGTAKSPALKLATWPLDVLQREAMQRFREQMAAYDDELEAWKRKDADGRRGEKPVKPTLRHYFSTNLTIEALVGMLERSPGVAIVRDEILSWVRSMDQYRGGKGSDRQEFLSLWAGATIKADRKGGEPVYRPFPVACVVGGIQPDFVAELHDEAQRRDGFVERLLPLVLDVGAARWTEATIASARFDDALAVFRALDRLPPADLDGDPTHPVGVPVRLHPDAKTLWTAWFDENAALAEQAPALAGGFSRKLPAHVARLGLILHALWHADDPRPMLSAERMEDAIAVGEFFREHVGRLLPLFGAAGSEHGAGIAPRILRLLRLAERDDAEGWASRSDLLNGLRNIPAAELSAALDELLAAGVVERRVEPGVTKPAEQWRRSPFGRSDYSDNPPGEHAQASADSDYSGKSEYSERPNDPTSEEPGSPEVADVPDDLCETVENILGLSADELAQYRAEVADSDPSCPYHDHDAAALAWAEELIRRRAA